MMNEKLKIEEQEVAEPDPTPKTVSIELAEITLSGIAHQAAGRLPLTYEQQVEEIQRQKLYKAY